MEFNIRMDKNQFSFRKVKEHEREDREYWKKASYMNKLMTITYLRECFYGPEATTGRLQRFYSFSKHK